MSFEDRRISAHSKDDRIDEPANIPVEIATFGAGCFWCIDACYRQTNGVHSVISGYTGGHIEDPTYDEIITGETGHAEVVQVAYDPNMIEYVKLLDVFWKVHNPTTENR